MTNYIFLMDQLKGEYREAFDKVYIYTNVRNMSGETEQEMMMNLMDMMLTAQNEGKPVEKIIGNDIEKFCKSYFEGYDYKIRVKEEIPQYINRIMWFAFVYGLINLIFAFGEKEFSLFKETIDVSGYLIGMLGGYLIILLNNVCVKPFIFKWKKISATIYDTILLVVMMVVVLVGCSIFAENELQVPLFPMIIVSGIYIVAYKIVKSVVRYKKYGTIWKRKEPFRESWLGSVKAEAKRQLPGELVKRYYKINKRRVRQGKELMTPEECMEKIRKENKQLDTAVIATIILIGIVIVGQAIYSIIFESILDAIIFALIMCAIEAPIFIIMTKAGNSRKSVLAECEKQGINIVEYAEKMENNQ